MNIIDRANLGRLTIVAMVSLLATGGCGRASSDSATLGAVSQLEQRATQLGCEKGDPDFLGADAFSCRKVAEPCGCTLLLRVDAHSGAVDLVKLDLIGCRAGDADEDMRTLLDPLVSERSRTTLHQFASTPRLPREDERHTAILQSETFEGVGAQALFGAQDSTNTGKARRTIWLAPCPFAASESRVTDVPRASICRVVAREPRIIPLRGYCDDESAQGHAPCELEPSKRGAYRTRALTAVAETHEAWRRAVRTVAQQGLLEKRRSREATAQALVGVLPLPTGSEMSEVQLLPSSIGTTRSALELAADAAAEWRDKYIWNVDSLFDLDLAKLVTTMTDVGTETVFVERLRRRLAATL